jgi:pimeloyl-ACP methyl ester carboxylesterase
MLERLAPHPWKTFADPLELQDEDAVWALPRTSIMCTAAQSNDPGEKWARSFAGDRVWLIDSGHDLMLTEPDQVAKLLLSLAT